MGPGGGGRGAEAVAVEVQPIARGEVEETTVLSGSLEPQYQVDVFSRRAGRLARMNVREGQRVRTGEPLAAVEHSDLLLQQQQAVAGLAASKASYRKTEAQRDKVAADYERVKLLYEQRASTQQELRNVTDQLREAEIQLEVAKAQLQQAESNVAMVKLQLNQVNTEASVSGVVIDTCHQHGVWLDNQELSRIVQFIQSGGMELARQRQEQERKHAEALKKMPVATELERSWQYGSGGGNTGRWTRPSPGSDLADQVVDVLTKLFFGM
jgi:multidrug efflux pump subunit AcrA (membrane-fusion protein)